MRADKSLFEQFFGVVARSQTWLNFIYLFLAFPLGLIYFLYLIIGLALGFGLAVIWVGLAILVLVVAGWWLLAGLERMLTISLLRVEIPPMSTPRSEKATTSTERLGAFIANPVTWKSLVYLLVKFPLGIVSFTVLTTLTAVTVILLASPIIFPFAQPEVLLTNGNLIRVDTLGEALVAFVVGLVMIFFSLHIFNGLAWVSGRFARVMLGNVRRPANPMVVTPPQTPETSVQPVSPTVEASTGGENTAAIGSPPETGQVQTGETTPAETQPN